MITSRQRLIGLGFNVNSVNNLTDEQVEAIVEPLESPETFTNDGELSEFEANEQYLNKLKKLKVSPLVRTIAKENILMWEHY